MNIAMFFSGKIRTYEKRHKLVQFIKDKNIDVFCSLNEEEIDHEFINMYNVKNYYVKPFILHEHFDITQIKQMIQKLHKRQKGRNFISFCSMYYNNMKNMELIEEYQNETGKKYDIIILHRTDIDNFIDFDVETKIESPVIMVTDWKIIGVNDHMAYGNFEMMKIYCNLFRYMYQCITNWPSVNTKHFVRTETLLEHYLHHQKVILKTFKVPNNYNLDESRGKYSTYDAKFCEMNKPTLSLF